MARAIIWMLISLYLLAVILSAIVDVDLQTQESKIFFWAGLGILAICEAITERKNH